MPENNYQNISIAIINYNSNRFLSDMFLYLDELVDKIEISIIDDRSNDGSIDKLRERYGGKIKITTNEKNSGASFTRNCALKNIDKKYLLFLDPDVRISADDIMKMVDRRERADIVFPRIDYFKGGTISPVNDFEKERCTNSAVYVINREKVIKTGQFFDEDMFVYNEDSDLFSRWWAFGFSFFYCDDIIALHPEKVSYSEKLFFYRARNPFILFVKQAGLIKFRMNPFLWIVAYNGLNFLAAVFNRNFSVASGGFEDVRVSDRKGRIIPRLRLVLIYFKAMLWNVFHFGVIWKKRQELKKQLRLK